MDYIKNNILNIAVLIILAILLLERCNDKKVEVVQPKADTSKPVIVYVQQPPQQVPQYQPIIFESKQPTYIPQQYQPVNYNDAALVKQVQELTNKLLELNTVKDSIQLKDSAGQRVGVVNLTDVVSENKIKSRDVDYRLQFPHSYTTITIKEAYKPRSQLYAGFGVTGSQTSLIQAFEAGLMYKNKRDQLYGVKAGIGINGSINYGVQSYWKIRLRK